MGRGPSADDDALDVLLVEERPDGAPGAERAGSPATGTPPEGSAARARPGPRRRTLAAVLAVLVVVVGIDVAGVVAEQRRQGDLLPGLLLPLPEAPVERWSAPGTLGAVSADGVLVIDQERLTMYDRSTGEERWRLTGSPASGLPYGECRPLVGGGWVARHRTPAEKAVCSWFDWGDGAGDELPGMRTGVDVVDLASGDVVPVAELPGLPMEVTAVEGGVVVVSADDDATHLLRADAAGEVRWRVTLAWEPLPAHDSGWRWSGGVTDGVAETPDGPVEVSYATGAVSPVTGPPVTVDEVVLADGSSVRAVAGHGATDGRTTVTAPDGTVLASPAEWLMPADMVDPRTAVVALGGRTGLRGLDRATGEERWRAGSVGMPRVQVDGVVLTQLYADEGRVAALDEQDGTVLWERLTGGVWADVSTDGHVVLVPLARGADPAPAELVAVGLHDGEERWRLDLPRATHDVTSAAGTLLVQSWTGVHVFGPADP